MSFVFPNHKKEAPFQGYMGFGGGATSLTLGGGLSAEALAGLVYANCSAGFRFNNGNTQYFGNETVNYVTFNNNNLSVNNSGGVSDTGCVNPGSDKTVGWASWNGNQFINQNLNTEGWRTKDFTIQWWYKGNDTADINNSSQPNYNWGAGIVVFGSDRNDVSGAFGMNAGKAGWGNLSDTNQRHQYSNSTINDGNWHQVVITNDNASASASTSKIYIDGSLNDTMNYDPSNNTGPVVQGSHIINGHYGYPSVSSWNGSSRMDLWSIWFGDTSNTPVLTAQQVSDLYNGGDLWS